MARSSLRPGTTPALIAAVLTIGLGVLFVIGALWVRSNTADCGGQTMQQGDTCVITYQGRTTDADLAGQQANNKREALILDVAGPLFMILGGYRLSKEVRVRRARAAAPAGEPLAMAGAGPLPGDGEFAVSANAAPNGVAEYNGSPHQARPRQ
ncbi:hypothetical protein [Actinospica robiniae]|uniref:hypothetical protein n=1 Tax=Actinospica robiniae TaxID=304901 RepID=UPI0005589914|nr:hypothetical protein [Actinospica robiniae]